MPRRFLAAITIVALLCGCAGNSVPPLEPQKKIDPRLTFGDRAAESAARSVVSGVSSFGAHNVLSPVLQGVYAGVPVGAQLDRDDKLQDDLSDGYGAILLRKGSDRNEKACRAFFQQPLETLAAIQTSNANNLKSKMRPTFWLNAFAPRLGETTLGGAKASKLCPTMIAGYDYERALFIMANFHVSDRAGPLLIAWRADAEGALIFDLSRYKTQRDFDKVFQIWQSQIATDPAIWNVSKVQEAPWYLTVRDALNEAGGAIEATVSIWRSEPALAAQQH